MAKQEYDKNQYLQNLCKVELESLIDSLRACIDNSNFVLDELFTRGGPDVFRHFDTYNAFILDVINRGRQFASHLREHDITSLLRQSTDATESKPADQYNPIKELCLPHLDLKDFEIGFILYGWVTYIQNEESLMFYVCQKHLDELLPKSIENTLVALPGESALPIGRIFGMRLTDGGQLRRAVLKQPNQLILVDTGEIMPVPQDYDAKFYELPREFALISMQAIYCKLAEMWESDKIGAGDFCIARKNAEVLRSIAKSYVALKVLQNNDNCLTVGLLWPHDGRQLTIMQSIALNSQIDFKTTNVESMSIFYGYIDKPMQETFRWSEDDLPVKQSAIHMPYIGELVLVQNPCDARWYRAKTLDFKKNTAMYRVFFVDFGNIESVPLSCFAPCHLSEAEAPFRALRCRLDDINEIVQVNNAAKMTSYEALCEVALNNTVKMQVKGRTEDALVVQFLSIETKKNMS